MNEPRRQLTSARDRRLLWWNGVLVGVLALGLALAFVAKAAGWVTREQQQLFAVALVVGCLLIAIGELVVLVAWGKPLGVVAPGSDLTRLNLTIADAEELAFALGLDAVDARCLLIAALDDPGVRKTFELAATDLERVRRALMPEPVPVLDTSTYRAPVQRPRLGMTPDANRLMKSAGSIRGAVPALLPIDLWFAAAITDTEARLPLRRVVSAHQIEIAAGHVDFFPRPDEVSKSDGRTPLLLHDDDVTPMTLVRNLIVGILGVSRAEANQLTMLVHDTKGAAVIGRFTQDVAEEHAKTFMRLAREAGYPLQATAGELSIAVDNAVPPVTVDTG